MRFLVDQAVSPQVARSLRGVGHDAIHVRDLGLAHAGDPEIFERAVIEKRHIISMDTDFGTLLTQSGRQLPSVILLRVQEGRPAYQFRLRQTCLNAEGVARDIETGAIVVLREASVRVRKMTRSA